MYCTVPSLYCTVLYCNVLYCTQLIQCSVLSASEWFPGHLLVTLTLSRLSQTLPCVLSHYHSFMTLITGVLPDCTVLLSPLAPCTVSNTIIHLCLLHNLLHQFLEAVHLHRWKISLHLTASATKISLVV